MQSRPICVVPDTNIWRNELLLKTPLGAAILYVVKRNDGTIGLPEVVEKEATRVIVTAGMEAVAHIEKNFRTVEVLLGSRPDYGVPTPNDFEACVNSRLAELQDVLLRVPFTIDHARSALDKVIQKLPPSSNKHEEYRDTAIWEAVLELANTHSVHFITGDQGFFKDRDPKRGLADNIENDVKQQDRSIFVYAELNPCLSALQKDTPSLSPEPLASAIQQAIYVDLETTVADRDFELREPTQYSINPYLTEKHGVLALQYDLTYRLFDTSQQSVSIRNDPQVITSGSCLYSMNDGTIWDLRKGSDVFRWRDEQGLQQQNVNHYAYGAAVLGLRQIQYTFRKPLPGANAEWSRPPNHSSDCAETQHGETTNQLQVTPGQSRAVLFSEQALIGIFTTCKFIWRYEIPLSHGVKMTKHNVKCGDYIGSELRCPIFWSKVVRSLPINQSPFAGGPLSSNVELAVRVDALKDVYCIAFMSIFPIITLRPA